MFVTEMKSEWVLQSWLGFLASTSWGMASVVADEALIWDTETGVWVLWFLLGMWDCRWSGVTAGKWSFAPCSEQVRIGFPHPTGDPAVRALLFCPCCPLFIPNRIIASSKCKRAAVAESSAEFRLSRIKSFLVLAVGRAFKIPCSTCQRHYLPCT